MAWSNGKWVEIWREAAFRPPSIFKVHIKTYLLFKEGRFSYFIIMGIKSKTEARRHCLLVTVFLWKQKHWDKIKLQKRNSAV